MIYIWKYNLIHYWNAKVTYFIFNWRPKINSLVTFFIRSNKKTQVYLTYFEKALKILFFCFLMLILINKFLIMDFSGWEGSNIPCLFSYDFNHEIRSLLFPRIHCYYDANVCKQNLLMKYQKTKSSYTQILWYSFNDYGWKRNLIDG